MKLFKIARRSRATTTTTTAQPEVQPQNPPPARAQGFTPNRHSTQASMVPRSGRAGPGRGAPHPAGQGVELSHAGAPDLLRQVQPDAYQLVAREYSERVLQLRWADPLTNPPATELDAAKEAFFEGVHASIASFATSEVDAEHLLASLLPGRDAKGRPVPAAGPLRADTVKSILEQIEIARHLHGTPPTLPIDSEGSAAGLDHLATLLQKLPAGEHLYGERGEGGIVLRSKRGDPSLVEKRAVHEALTRLVDRAAKSLPDDLQHHPDLKSLAQDIPDGFRTNRSGHPTVEATTLKIGLLGQFVQARSHHAEGPDERPMPEATPTEAAVTLLDAVIRERRLQPHSEELAALERDIKHRWITSAVDFDSTLGFLDQVQGDMKKIGLTDLSGVATRLRAELASQIREIEEDQFEPGSQWTRIHDNVNGRVWESALAAELLRTPSPRMLQAGTALKRHAAALLEGLDDRTTRQICQVAQGKLKQLMPRASAGNDETLSVIANHPNPVSAFQEFLRHPSSNGTELMNTYPVVGQILASAEESLADAQVPWAQPSRDNYAIIKKARGESQIAGKTLSTGTGLGLLYHSENPPLEPGGHRPAVTRAPLSAGLMPVFQRALEHGKPVIAGPSGITDLFLFFLDDVDKKAPPGKARPFDIDDMMLGLMAMLAHDGDHSFHEVLWVMNQAAGKLGLDLESVPGEPVDFVSNYRTFFDRFDGETRTLLERAIEVAWTETLAKRQERLKAARTPEEEGSGSAQQPQQRVDGRQDRSPKASGSKLHPHPQWRNMRGTSSH